MNIGIIVYSKTGNTLHVAKEIRASLEKEDDTVTVACFCAETEPQSNKPIKLTSMPDPTNYDVLILGAPVQAFSLDPAMKMYLNKIGAIKPVPTLCFITQHFKKPWLGGNRAMKQLLILLKEKGISAKPLGIVNWSSDRRGEQIATLAQVCADAVLGNRT